MSVFAVSSCRPEHSVSVHLDKLEHVKRTGVHITYMPHNYVHTASILQDGLSFSFGDCGGRGVWGDPFLSCKILEIMLELNAEGDKVYQIEKNSSD